MSCRAQPVRVSNNESMEQRLPLQLRRATSVHAHAIASVHIASWQRAYRGLLPAAFLDGLDVEERASRYGFDGPGDPEMWIALGDDVVGFVAVGACRDADAKGVGEIQALYVAPERWRSGVGSLLLNRGEGVLAEMGFLAASLWVLEANEGARRFYEAANWHREDRTNSLSLAGVDVTEIRYHKALM
jgi:GNAT superfamily N-acetyltransferase